MGISKKLLKGAAYVTHPKGAFALLNPKKAIIAKALEMAVDHIPGRSRRPSRTAIAARGLGAAALAMPIGFWIAHRMERDRSRVTTG